MLALPAVPGSPRTAAPLEQAYPPVCLCSDAARVISGITLITDAGYLTSGTTLTGGLS
jgi:hypothetical protein